MLIRKGADVDVIRTDGSTALCMASIFGYSEIVNVIPASSYFCVTRIIQQALVEEGAAVDVVLKNSGTSLHFASFNGHLEIAKVIDVVLFLLRQ